MMKWVRKGLASGIKSTRYPAAAETAPGVSPGRPRATRLAPAAAEELAARCPSGALTAQSGGIAVAHGRCVHCARCRQGEVTMSWENGYEWAGAEVATLADGLARAFGRSLHIRYLDAGACGACMSEARQLNNPYYNMHRLGFFITATPRTADVLLVAGPVTDAMRVALRATYDAMPEPKRVVAMGACALSGGVFGPSYAAGTGAAEVVPVDVQVPGCPPPPLALLHALLVVVERKPPQALGDDPPEAREGRT